MRRRIYGVVAGVLSLAGASTLVCFPVYAEAGAKISIIEQVEDGSGGYKPWKDITGAMPGESYSAIPQVKNNSSAAAEVAMCVSGSVKNAAGVVAELPAGAFEIDIDEHWILDGTIATDVVGLESADCYRYESAVKAGEMTEPIFTEVTLSKKLGNEYKNSVFSLYLQAFLIGEPSDDGPGGLPEDEEPSGKPDDEPSGGSDEKPSGGSSGTKPGGSSNIVPGGAAGESGGAPDGIPREPSTNVLTVQEPLARANRVLSGLSVAAVIVLLIHFGLAIYRKRQKDRKRRKNK